jgi:hypothetical protein
MEKLYEIGSSSDKTYICARAFRHPFTAHVALWLARDIVRHGKKIDVLGCLIDVRGAASVLSVAEYYEFANEKANIVGLPHHWRYAFVIDYGDDSPDLIIETFMQIAGYMFQIFEDEQEAIDWLKSALSNE